MGSKTYEVWPSKTQAFMVQRRVIWRKTKMVAQKQNSETSLNSSSIWKLTGKFGRSTKEREEEEVLLDGWGVTYDLFSKGLKTAFDNLLGSPDKLSNLIAIAGPSERILYHPDGDTNIDLEIKFDIQVGETFDGKMCPIFLIEIEYKNGPKEMTKKKINELLDQEEETSYRTHG